MDEINSLWYDLIVVYLAVTLSFLIKLENTHSECCGRFIFCIQNDKVNQPTDKDTPELLS